MPKKDKTGPPKESTGPRDGRGQGRGWWSEGEGEGKMTGGKKGDCDEED